MTQTIKISSNLISITNWLLNFDSRTLDKISEKYNNEVNEDSKKEIKEYVESIFINGNVEIVSFSNDNVFEIVLNYEGLIDAFIEDFGSYNEKHYKNLGAALNDIII